MRRLSLGAAGLVVAGWACARATEAPDAAVVPARPVEAPVTPARTPPGGGTGSDHGQGTIGLSNIQPRDAGPPVPHVRLMRIEVEGGDPVVLRRVVRPHLGELLACYEPALARVAGLRGRFEVRLEIRADGTVARAEKGASAMNDRPLERCLLAAARSWRFPAGATPSTALVPLYLTN